MGTEITYLHHVGHVVRNLASCIDLYRRLGFSVGAVNCPVVSMTPGEAPTPFGIANAHIELSQNFLELATVVSDQVPLTADATLTPLHIPGAALTRVLDSLRRTVGSLSEALARFEGLHILVLGTSDITKSVASFNAADVRNGGINTVTRDAGSADGGQTLPIRSFEIDGVTIPEGRVAVAEMPPPDPLHEQITVAHPNGATALVEVILCVAPTELDMFQARYTRYLGRHAQRTDDACIFEMGDAVITIVSPIGLGQILPDERPATLPAFAAFVVTVQSLDEVKAQLSRSGLPASMSFKGDIFVPASSALGVAVIFRARSP